MWGDSVFISAVKKLLLFNGVSDVKREELSFHSNRKEEKYSLLCFHGDIVAPNASKKKKNNNSDI